MTDTIISLCYVKSIRERSAEICRIADFKDGTLIPYIQPPYTNFEGINRDLIYSSPSDVSGNVGSIGLYEWFAYQNEYQEWRTEFHAYNMLWIEVVQMQCLTIGEIVERFRRGWSPVYTYDGKHDVIFCTMSSLNTRVEAIYVPHYALEQREGKWFFSDSISTVEYSRMD